MHRQRVGEHEEQRVHGKHQRRHAGQDVLKCRFRSPDVRLQPGMQREPDRPYNLADRAQGESGESQ